MRSHNGGDQVQISFTMSLDEIEILLSLLKTSKTNCSKAEQAYAEAFIAELSKTLEYGREREALEKKYSEGE